MKIRRSEIESLVNLLLYSFKNGNNLPFVIPTKTCPDLKPSKNLKMKRCNKKHSEIVVKSYLPDGKKYRLLYHGMHTTGRDVYTFDQEEEILKQIIIKSMKKKKYGGKTLLEVRKIKKMLYQNSKNNSDKRIRSFTMRLTDKEMKSIESKAQNRGLELSDYGRMKLLF